MEINLFFGKLSSSCLPENFFFVVLNKLKLQGALFFSIFEANFKDYFRNQFKNKQSKYLTGSRRRGKTSLKGKEMVDFSIG